MLRTYANNCREIGALQIFFLYCALRFFQQTFPLCFLEVLEFSYFFFFAKTDLCAHVFRTYDVVVLLSSRALVIHDLQFHDCFARRSFAAARDIWQNPLMKYWLSERQSRHT